MEKLLLQLGRLAGIGGTAICVGAVLARLGGIHWIGSFETITLLQSGGIAMTFACLCFLAVLAQQRKS